LNTEERGERNFHGLCTYVLWQTPSFQGGGEEEEWRTGFAYQSVRSSEITGDEGGREKNLLFPGEQNKLGFK